MKRQLSDSDQKLSNKVLTKTKATTFGSSYSRNDYFVYWFDEFHNNLLKYYNIDQSRLRAIIDYLQIFDQFDQYETTIRQNIENKLFLIVNASMCIKMLTLFDDFPEIHSIYTYKDNENNDQLFLDQCKTFKKFKGIFQNPKEIFSKLSETLRIYTRHQISEETSGILISMTEKAERTTGLHSQIELMNWFTYFYNVLEEIPPSNYGKTKFVKQCRDRYKDTPSILGAIAEFDEKYDPNKAIWWYTREGFLFRLLNLALRQQDQKDLLLIHFFIYDLDRQLKIESDQNKNAEWMSEHIYRGQLMSIDEIKFIQRRIQHTLYVNTFLSTSTDLDLVKIFAGVGFNDLDAPLQSVIFDITGDVSGGPAEKSVADIHHLSFSNDENEILFSPSYTFVPTDVIYDQNEKVWNIHLHRVIDAYDLNIQFDQRLIKLDLLIRLMLDHTDLCTLDQTINDQHKQHFYPTFPNDIALLIEELNDYKSANITLNDIDDNNLNIGISPYELTALRTFSESSLNKDYKISSLLATTLNDCLANLYKQNGKYHLAFEHLNKAISYINDEENIRTKFTRKMSFAQTHKLFGDYVSAWSIFEELEEEDLTDLFHYERLFRDIALDLSNDTNTTLLDKLCNCFDYLEYVYTQADLDANGFTISETYVELGKMFLDNCQNCEKAIVCFNRDLQIRRISDPDESLGFGPVYERLADAYAFFDTEKALQNYEKAIDQYSLLGALSIIDMALCLCKLGELRSEHQVEPFNRALTLILSIDNQQFQLNRDEISSCLLHLAKSCSRCESLAELALEICQTAFRLYPYDPESKPGINNDFEQCIDLILTLHQKKRIKDGSIAPSKDEILERWKCFVSRNTMEMIEILNSIQEKVNGTNIENK